MALTNYEKVYRHKQKRKQELIYIAGGKCIVCGYDKCLNALEFHHTDPTQKEFKIFCNGGKAFEKQISEIRKCTVLCANCHREYHAGLIHKELQPSFDEERYIYIKEKYKDKKIKKNKGTKQKRLLPKRENLKNDIRTMPFLQVAKKYQVSDNAIRKWCKKYGLPHKALEIRNISDAEWELI